MSNYFADISSNNGANGYNPAVYASAGYAAISIKATEGTGYVNPYYAGERQWVRDSHRHNLAVLHYHFCRPENGNPKLQARHFWETVREHFRRPGDYLVWDLETGNPGEANGWLHEADRELRLLSGGHPVVYTYLSYFNSGGIVAPSRNIWMAAYGSRRPGTWNWKLPRSQSLWAWQYTDGNGFGPGPQRFAGIGQSDGSILNVSTARYLRKVRRPR